MSLRDRLLEPEGVLRGALFQDLLRTRFPEDDLPPGERIGAWRIAHELGRGGMGRVYLAERGDGEFDQRVALKWLPDAATSPGGEALFRRERQILAGLSHPGIARLVDGGHTDDGHLWFAMEYVEGLPIDRHAQAHALDERARVALLLPVLEAVAFAHGRLVIHRDIKPGNVLIDAQGQARLLDFGIAGLAAEGEHAHAFTPDFASPEQRALQPVGTASDIWQLGRLLEAVLQADASRPSARDLQAIIAMATAERPRDRYATVAALKNDLLRYLERRPVLARRGGAAYRLRRLAQRHPIGALATAMGSGALLALVAGFLVYAASEQARLRQARDETAAINQFLAQDVLGASDPFFGRGDERPIAATLEEGVARAQARFRDHPGVAGRIVVALGQGLLSRGRYDAAERAADRAVVLLQGADGPRARTTAEALLLRATVDMHRGRPEQARVRLATLHAAFPYRPDAPSTLEWRIEVERGWNAFLRNRFDDCVGIYSRLLQQPGAAGEGERSEAHATLSACEVSIGRYAQALRNGEIAERLAVSANGPRSGNAALARIRIALALSGLGRHDEAARRFQAEVERLIALLGEAHGTTATYMDHLGVVYLCGNDNARAVEWTARGLHARRLAFGPTHPWTIGVEAQYAVALLRAGDVAGARAAIAHVESLRRQSDTGSQVWIYRALGEWYLRDHQPDRAVAYYRAARALAAQPGMQVRWHLHAIDGGLALALSQAGRSAQARQAYAAYDASARFDKSCASPLSRDVDADRARRVRADGLQASR